MPEANYRYYCLDAVGQLHDARWFHADDDEQAIAMISARHPDGKCEIWHGSRLVASISPSQRSGVAA